MEHPNQRHGNHTWDIVLHYEACPKCHYIIENRAKFEKRFQQLEKEIVCPRCQKQLSGVMFLNQRNG